MFQELEPQAVFDDRRMKPKAGPDSAAAAAGDKKLKAKKARAPKVTPAADDADTVEAAAPAARKAGPAGVQGGVAGGKVEKSSKTRRRRELRKKQRVVAGAAAAAVAAAAGGEAAAGGDGEQQLSLKPPSKKKRKREAQAAAMQAAVPDAAAVVEPADTAAWGRYHLHPAVLDGLAVLGFAAPTAVQAAFLPVALRDGRDVMCAAETGSGKTLAFGLPILHFLAGRPPAAAGHDLAALVLCPTRELAIQVSAHIQAAGSRVPGNAARCVALVGGLATQKQARMLAKRPPIVVATPGRLWELMSGGETHLQRLARLRFLVLDEADRMIEKGHYAELTNILSAVEAASGSGGDPQPAAGSQQRRQTFVLSATLVVGSAFRQRLTKPGAALGAGAKPKNSKQGTVSALLERVPFTGTPAVIDCTNKARPVASRILEAVFEGTDEERDAALCCILSQYPGRTLVFCNAISCVRRVAALLTVLRLPCAALHASQQQRQRLNSLDKFTNGGLAGDSFALVATDVAARGLDIPGVRTVIHYQAAPSAESYVHRCGRTARGGVADGAAVTLVTPAERTRYVALCRATGVGPAGLPRLPLDHGALKAANRRCVLARKLDALQHARRKAQGDAAWKKKNAEELGLEVSDEEEEDGPSKQEDEQAQTSVEKELRRQLDELLAIPLGAKGLSRNAKGGTRQFPTFGAAPAPGGGPSADVAALLKAKTLAAGKPAGSGTARLKRRRLAGSMRAAATFGGGDTGGSGP